jgi:hypothetical protein
MPSRSVDAQNYIGHLWSPWASMQRSTATPSPHIASERRIRHSRYQAAGVIFPRGGRVGPCSSWETRPCVSESSALCSYAEKKLATRRGSRDLAAPAACIVVQIHFEQPAAGQRARHPTRPIGHPRPSSRIKTRLASFDSCPRDVPGSCEVNGGVSAAMMGENTWLVHF